MRTPKFGARLRNLYDAAGKTKRARYACPKCGKERVKRTSYALWECGCCGAKIAGGAYMLETETGSVARRIAEEYGKA